MCILCVCIYIYSETETKRTRECDRTPGLLALFIPHKELNGMESFERYNSTGQLVSRTIKHAKLNRFETVKNV